MRYLFVPFFIIIDQACKISLTSFVFETTPSALQGGKVWDFFPFFSIYLTYNKGISFSLFSGSTVPIILFTCVGILLLAIASRYFHLTFKSKLIDFAFVCILSGGLGNLLDRIRIGAVIDYISIGTFPIFNFADICVCTGAGLFLLGMLLIWRDETKKKQASLSNADIAK
jgi:signal peptidase II